MDKILILRILSKNLDKILFGQNTIWPKYYLDKILFGQNTYEPSTAHAGLKGGCAVSREQFYLTIYESLPGGVPATDPGDFVSDMYFVEYYSKKNIFRRICFSSNMYFVEYVLSQNFEVRHGFRYEIRVRVRKALERRSPGLG